MGHVSSVLRAPKPVPHLASVYEDRVYVARAPVACSPTEPDLPPFSLTTPKHDQSTFWGRYYHFLDIIDPRTLVHPESKVKECISLLNAYRDGDEQVRSLPDEELWRIRKIKESAVHPDTGEIIPLPFRMSGFVPFGVPILAGVLAPGNGLAVSLFWQWLNQTQNAAVNYYNRNASQPMSTESLAVGYVGAVSSALGVVTIMERLVSRGRIKGVAAKMIPFLGVASANVANIVLMRWAEMKTGIEVKDENGTPRGISQAAARDAVMNTAITRIVMPIPNVAFPPLLLSALSSVLPVLKNNPRYQFPTQVLLISCCFMVGLPLSIACFPQEGSIKAASMEPEFQAIAKEHPTLYYNKGL